MPTAPSLTQIELHTPTLIKSFRKSPHTRIRLLDAQPQTVDLSTGYKEKWHGMYINRIGDFAFDGCTALEKVIFNYDLPILGQEVFYECPLKHVHYLGRTAKYLHPIDCTADCTEHYDEKETVNIIGTTNGKCTLSKDRKMLYGCNENNGGTCPTGIVVIPEEVPLWFSSSGSYGINSITFPDSLEYIYGDMFKHHVYNDPFSAHLILPFFSLTNLKISMQWCRQTHLYFTSHHIVPLPMYAPNCIEYFLKRDVAEVYPSILKIQGYELFR